MNALKMLKKINEWLKKIELVFGTAGLLVIFFLITINIFKRYFFHNAWGWAGELNGFIYAWIAFISAAYTMANDGHIQITLLQDRFGNRLHHLIRMLTDIFAVAGFALLIRPTVSALRSMTFTSALRWPKGAVYSGILVGFILYIIHLSIQVVRHFYFLKTNVDFMEDEKV